MPDGAAAEYVVAPAEILAPAPSSIPLADAAAMPTVGLAAWQALFWRQAGAGQRVLVNGAGRAVGGYAVQLAKAPAPTFSPRPARGAANASGRLAPTRSSITPPPASPRR